MRKRGGTHASSTNESSSVLTATICSFLPFFGAARSCTSSLPSENPSRLASSTYARLACSLASSSLNRAHSSHSPSRLQASHLARPEKSSRPGREAVGVRELVATL